MGTKVSKKNKTLIILASIISFILIIILGVYIFIHMSLSKVEKVKLPEDLGIPEKIEVNKDPNIINIAFFGVDRRSKSEEGRSDSIMVISIDKEHNKIKAASLMRDMYVDLPDRGGNRINAAYQFGGAGLAIKTINTNFGLNIKNFVTVDFFGLEKLIDKVGGVTINLSSAEAKNINDSITEGPKISAGTQKLNGRQAVAYSRIRHVGNADYERTERQRRVLNELYKKIKAQGAGKIPSIVNSMLPYVETSFSNNEILSMAMDVLNIGASDLQQYRLPIDGGFTSQSIRGMSVLVPDIPKNKEALLRFIYEDFYKQ